MIRLYDIKIKLNNIINILKKLQTILDLYFEVSYVKIRASLPPEKWFPEKIIIVKSIYSSLR